MRVQRIPVNVPKSKKGQRKIKKRKKKKHGIKVRKVVKTIVDGNHLSCGRAKKKRFKKEKEKRRRKCFVADVHLICFLRYFLAQKCNCNRCLETTVEERQMRKNKKKKKENEETTKTINAAGCFSIKRTYKTKKIPRVLMFLPVFEANFSNAAS